MSYEEFKSSESYRRMYIKVLDPYESKVYSWLDEHPDLSASQIHDWLRERYQDLPDVNAKTVYNYVKYIRAKYGIEKPPLSSPRQYCKIEETAYGEYAQVDFGDHSSSLSVPYGNYRALCCAGFRSDNTLRRVGT